MTVSSQTSNETFNGNGVTTVWDLPFRFFDNADIQVFLLDPATQAVTPMAIGTDYTLSGAGLPEQFGAAPGKITTTVPVPTLKQLYVERVMEVEQLTDIVNQGRFFAEVHEDVFDRLTMLIQQFIAWISRALVRPVGKNYYDAEQRNISNVADPVSDQDAANKRWTTSLFSQANNYAYSLYLKSIAYAEALVAGVVGGYGSFLQDGLGAVIRTFQDKQRESFSIRDFGAIGDGNYYPVSDWYTPSSPRYRNYANLAEVQVYYPHVTLATQSIDWAATQAAYTRAGAALFGVVEVPTGVFVINEAVLVPRFVTTIGKGRGSWYPVGRNRTLLNNVLDMTHGSIFKSALSGTITASSNRTETYFQNARPLFLCEPDSDGIHFKNIKIINGFDIRDGSNNITTQTTDNSANFDIGIWFRDGDDCSLDNVVVGGYFKTSGVLLDGSGRTSTSPAVLGGIERFTINNSVIQGWIGLAIVGGDEGVMPSATNPSGIPATGDDATEGQFGMSHILVSNTHLFAENHHSNGFVGTQDEQYARQRFGGCALYIDGRVNGGGLVGRINNPRFVNVSIQTNDSFGAIFDHVSRPTLVNFRCESRPINFTRNCVLPQLVNCEIPYKRGLDVDRTYIINGGSGYTSPPTVTFTAPTTPGAATATGTAVLLGDKVSYITLVSGGSGYIAEPTISFSGGGGSGASARSILARQFQSAEFCSGPSIIPSIRRINNAVLAQHSFVIEFRNNAGVIEHRMGSTVGGLFSLDVESVMRYAREKFPAWDYTEWAVSPQPAATHDFSKGVFLGPPGVGTKSAIYTPISIEGISAITQESRWHQAFADVVLERFTETEVTADCDFYGAQVVDGRAPLYSGCLRIVVKSNGAGISLTTLPSEVAGTASLRLHVHGLMYPQIWGSI